MKLSGRVYDAVTSEPMIGATVRVLLYESDIYLCDYWTQTGLAGEYDYADVINEDVAVFLEAHHVGYASTKQLILSRESIFRDDRIENIPLASLNDLGGRRE